MGTMRAVLSEDVPNPSIFRIELKGLTREQAKYMEEEVHRIYQMVIKNHKPGDCWNDYIKEKADV